MVKVHIWMPDSKYVGHTALTVRNVYISFWPDGEAGKKDLKISRFRHSNGYPQYVVCKVI